MCSISARAATASHRRACLRPGGSASSACTDRGRIGRRRAGMHRRGSRRPPQQKSMPNRSNTAAVRKSAATMSPTVVWSQSLTHVGLPVSVSRVAGPPWRRYDPRHMPERIGRRASAERLVPPSSARRSAAAGGGRRPSRVRRRARCCFRKATRRSRCTPS